MKELIQEIKDYLKEEESYYNSSGLTSEAMFDTEDSHGWANKIISKTLELLESKMDNFNIKIKDTEDLILNYFKKRDKLIYELGQQKERIDNFNKELDNKIKENTILNGGALNV